MQFRVLGCYGGSAPSMRPTSFLFNDKIALDAGAITTTLSLREQSDIQHIIFSHSHIDHLATLPFLLDNIFSTIQTPLILYGPEHTIHCLKKHFFNDELWPDFTKFANEQSSIVKMQPLKEGETLEVEGLKITTAPMDHTVDCYGYLVDSGKGSIFVSGDTLSLEGALPLLARADQLEMIVLEASFPNRMQRIADLSRHLTPAGFAEQLKKLPEEVPVLVTHMKPECLGEIQQEIAQLALARVSLIEQGATYEIGPPGGE